MTKINKIVMHGFKSFAKHTELVFGDDFNCVLGPNGSGKSCSYSTEVILESGEIKQIGELVAERLKKAKVKKKMDDGVYTIELDPIKTYGLDPKGMRLVEKNIIACIKRDGDPFLYEITTKLGKKVKTTGCHPVMIYKDGEIISEVVKNLWPKAMIATPRSLNLKGKFFYINIDARKIKVDEKFARFLGYMIGDGSIEKTRCRFVNSNNIIMDDFILCGEYVAKKKAIFRNYPYRNTFDAWLNSKSLVTALNELLGCNRIRSHNKDIPGKILLSNISVLSNFLAALYDCDGTVSKTTPTIELTTASKKLAEHTQLALLRFGIIARLQNKYKKATNARNKQKKEYYSVVIEGKNNLQKFYVNIKMLSEKKKETLSCWISRFIKVNPNIDVLPQESNQLIKKCKEILRIPCKPLRRQYPFFAAYIEDRCCPTREGISKALLILKNKLRLFKESKIKLKLDQKALMNHMQSLNLSNVDAARFIGVTRHAITDFWKKGLFRARRDNLKKLYNFIKKEIDRIIVESARLMKILENLSSSDIFWDQIVSIKKVKGEPYVYDLTIPDCHNFIGNGIFVHNSNILDALCFVLGKSSTKSLRAERASNLIYNGGKSKKPAKQGEVSIYFDNKEKTFPTEDPEVKITRIVRQTGQSIYKINDKVRTRQQIVDLLNVAKIDPNGYNIILQGDIVRFTEMPSIERRMLIEEISGISVYEEKKHKAMLELQKVEQKLNDAELILRERNTYLKELKKDRDEALKYKDMSDKIKQYKASYLKIQIDREEKQETDLKIKIEGLNKELEKLNSKVAELKKQNKEKKESIEKISREIEEKGEKGQVELNKEIEALKILMARHNSRIETCKNEIEKIKKRKEDLQSEDKEVFYKIKSLNENKKGYDEEIKKLKKQISEFDNKIKVFKEKNKMEEAADLEKEVDNLDKKSEELQKEIQALREEEHNLLRQKDRIEHNLAIIDEKIEKVKEIEKEYKDDIEAVRKKRDEFKSMTIELNKKLSEDTSISQQIAENRKKLTNAIEELAKLEARSVGIKEHIIADIAVKKILELKKAGVYGTVADLGEVNSKYALAIEVAAGPRLKSIVVEDDKIASECIKYLKQNKFGVATFLPLNKIKAKSVKAEIKSLAKAKGSHGLAIELVSFDNKFKNIFEHIFADTIIVDNIDTARRLGIGKAKMVSLDGDIAEISGVMQGGFRQRKKQSYGFKEKEITKDIKEYENSIKELKNVISTLEKKREELEEKIEDLRSKKANLDGEIIKTEKSLHLEAGDVDLSKKQKQDFQKDLEKTNKLISNLEEKIKSKNKELTSYKIKRQELRNQITQLRDPALLAELSAFQEKKRELSEEIIKYESEMKNIDTQINIYEQDTGKTTQILKQLDKDGVSFNEEIKKINLILEEKQKVLAGKEEKAKDFYAKFKSLFDKRNKISQEIQKNETTIEDKQGKSREIEININTISLKKAEITARLSALNQEFEQYHGVEIISKSEEELKKEISKFEKMRDEIGSVNMRALEIYEEVEKEYNKLLEKKEKLLKEKGSVEDMMKEIESKKKDLFMKTYDVITENFKRIFSLLTKKGDAHLQLENPDNPFEAGLNIKVKIIGNKFLDIRSLSGGEKTLTALAFIFAIQEHEPAKFYVLDEVDAALDKHNSEKFASLIKKYAENAQYIIISHNDSVVTEATNLYGVSMNEHGMSQAVSLKI